jgi:hypothetical protein
LSEQPSRAGTKYKPPVYLSELSVIVATTSGCDVIVKVGGKNKNSIYMFIGIGVKPELASYTFDVLRRKITNDRSEYLKILWRYKRENKTRKADVFVNPGYTESDHKCLCLPETETKMKCSQSNHI